MRETKKQKLNELLQENPAIATHLQTREKMGRPRVEENQTDLLKVC